MRLLFFFQTWNLRLLGWAKTGWTYLWSNKFLKRKIVRIPLLGLVIFIGLDLLFPFQVKPSYSTLVVDKRGHLLHAFLNQEDKWRMFTQLEEISPTLEKAILFKEDQYFYYHVGINPLALVRAIFQNVQQNRRASGASTITMQVVRLIERRPRTYLSKVIELFRALQLEWHFSKKEILQLYLNLVPYGSNVEGVKSAAILYFQKPPQVLSLAEVATLSVVPNRPSSWRLGRHNPQLLQARNLWLRRFGEAGLFEASAVADALREPLQIQRHEAPKQAPHWAYRLRRQFPEQPILVTTLDYARQQQAEALTRNFVSRLRALQILNAAVMVIDNRRMSVEAYVGSADFDDPTDGGQVDGVVALRSPGSTLKPLLYATAFDKGMLTPQTMLYDVPSNFSGFEPENFDKLFHGKVSVSYALANSLNVPAVRVLQDISTQTLVEKLKQADFKHIKKTGSKLGLSLVLGGCSVTLEELTQLFAALSQGGRFRKAHSRVADSASYSSVTLLSESSSYLITHILSQIQRPDLPNNYDYTYRMPKVAWKTGTSFGKKDAWSIGYNSHYTIGVWVGNFSGRGVPELSGANIATPLLFDLFNAIDYNKQGAWFGQPKALALRKVCAESGLLPQDFCPNVVLDYHVPGVSPMQRCGHARQVWTDPAGSLSYCTQCQPDSGAVRRLYPNQPPELLAWYESKHILYEKIPPHNPRCSRIFGQAGPKITFPVRGNTYYLSREEQSELQLSCQAESEVKEVYWYVNDRLVATAPPHKAVFIQPPGGKLRIACTDDKGRSSEVNLTIVWH
jgi:penicillin-binding protein 1C